MSTRGSSGSSQRTRGDAQGASGGGRERRGLLGLLGIGRRKAPSAAAPAVPVPATPSRSRAQTGQTGPRVERAPRRGVAEVGETDAQFAARMAALPTKTPAELRQMAKEAGERMRALAQGPGSFNAVYPEQADQDRRDAYADGMIVNRETGRVTYRQPSDAPLRDQLTWWRAVAKWHPDAPVREHARSEVARLNRLNAQARRERARERAQRAQATATTAGTTPGTIAKPKARTVQKGGQTA